MLLSDGGLLDALATGDIDITPMRTGGDPQIQPASIDVHLGEDLRIFTSGGEPVIDPERRQELTVAKRIPEQGFYVDPEEFLLGTTVEAVTIGAGYAMQFTGKSSLARLGLTVHQTAGHLDPGFSGVITLEIKNVNIKPFKLRRGMPIGQLLVYTLDAPAIHPYGHADLRSLYYGQSTVTESRSWM